jgi:uncharacterized membrane protein YccC
MKRARAVVFVARCAGAATAAYGAAHLPGLPEALWATMSAIIVSQEHLSETRSSFTGRILGTLLGMGVTIAVNTAASRMAVTMSVQMAIAIALCACVASWFPSLRVAMWTCPLILLTADPSVSIVTVALRRGSEVTLGAIVGWLFHWVAEVAVDALETAMARRRSLCPAGLAAGRRCPR